ncbi:unnamed protein product [Candidula unifasciata]|uniref:Uncharacterized protein n=1 Tax=Candidula unifasciata TaxID=100452 RepID=A0A8S3YEB5_9EUPU|nr:unnamed protein product [Candidula unifasciata]
MQKLNLSPYPGFDETGSYIEQHPNTRVRPDGEEYANKSKGCINLFISEKHKHVIPPPPSPRLPSREARNNYEISKTGHIGNLLGGTGQPPPKEPMPVARLTMESMSIAESHKGQQMNTLFTKFGQHGPSARPPSRVKHEAEDSADLGRGGRMNALLHNPNSIPDTPRSVPRVRLDATEIAEKGVAGSMAKVFGQYGTNLGSCVRVPRVKPEAEMMAKLDRGIQVERLFHEYGKQKTITQPAPKVRDGKEMAAMDRGVRMSKLMHEIEKLPSNPRPHSRITSAAGRRNMKNNRGSISNIFAETSKWQIIPKVGVRH